jgi:hypothetical protein
VRNQRTDHFTDEESETDTDRREESGLVLHDGQHDDDEYQLGCEEHLDEQTLRDGCASTQSSSAIEVTRKQSADNACSCNATYKLCDEDGDASNGWHASDQA